MDESEEDTLISMQIDEEKYLTPYNITGDRMIPSDHCAITAEFNWLVRPKDEEEAEMYLNTNRNNTEKFLRMTSGRRLNNAIQNGNIQEKYTNWEKELDS